MMLVHVIDAKYVDGYRVEVSFNDGRKGIADLREALRGPVFESLKDETEFRRFVVDKELETLVWENGADLAPEYIYFQAFRNDRDLQERFKKWGYLN
ncbi:MAG TPA: DUF2442 domain-containing protein [Pyrinomonadaceae bacterium]|nr:DUF2442 domain-containing protein [Pyrinomonadaceae bacterium]